MQTPLGNYPTLLNNSIVLSTNISSAVRKNNALHKKTTETSLAHLKRVVNIQNTVQNTKMKNLINRARLFLAIREQIMFLKKKKQEKARKSKKKQEKA